MLKSVTFKVFLGPQFPCQSPSSSKSSSPMPWRDSSYLSESLMLFARAHQMWNYSGIFEHFFKHIYKYSSEKNNSIKKNMFEGNGRPIFLLNMDKFKNMSPTSTGSNPNPWVFFLFLLFWPGWCKWPSKKKRWPERTFPTNPQLLLHWYSLHGTCNRFHN